MIGFIIKRVICSKVNNLLKKYKHNADKAREVLTLWINRLKKILVCFESMLKKIDDGELSQQELNEASDEVMIVIKEWQ